MGYHKMTIEDLYSIFRRWHQGHLITHIAVAEGRDRKTIRAYIKQFKLMGYEAQGAFPDKDSLMTALEGILPQTDKKRPRTSLLDPYREEIEQLLNHSTEPVKIKTAWQIIQQKHGWQGSYEAFKLYVNSNKLNMKGQQPSTIRIELPPGLETQVDYGKVGNFFDRSTGTTRAVQAFCGLLTHSRLPFIEFCFSQDECSFTRSHVKMFTHFEGATQFISIDNLKAGVIKPDLYDPKINRTYQEMAEYYQVFIDPCRVRRPKDKGKVERLVPLARELFRRLKNVHPHSTLEELNKQALRWCKEEYGRKKHGTTGTPPLQTFLEREKPHLIPLPALPFESCLWKKVRVHTDQFISFEKKRYSLPAIFKGKAVWVKKSEPHIDIYHDFRLVRRYLIPAGHMEYRKEDFPEVLREMIEGGLPAYLLESASKLGESAHALVKSILTPHAYLNARRAQAVLELLKRYYASPVFEEVCQKALKRRLKKPDTLKIIFEETLAQPELPFEEGMSDRGKAMLRDAGYYLN